MTSTDHDDIPIPAGIEDIDDEWLSTAMATPVRISDIKNVGEGYGMVSSLYRIWLAGDDPGSVIVKLPSLDEAAQFAATILRLNIREVGFYRELAADSPIRVPHAYHAAVNDETHQFVLVIEDLIAWRAVDQVQGMRLEDAQRSIAALASWHLKWWQAAAPIVSRGTAIAIGDPIYPMILPAVFAEGWQKLLSEMNVPAALRAAGDHWSDALPGLLESFAQEPSTLVHGDYRADNMFFSDTGELALVDFQVIGESTAVGDLAYFVTASLPAEVASRSEQDLFSLWRDTLLAGGRKESELAHMWELYRKAVFFCVVYVAVAARGMDLQEARQRALLEAAFGRFERAADELRLADLY